MNSMNDITSLRESLFDTIKGVKDGSITLDKAKTINDLSQTIINSAKVEVDYMATVKATHGTGFINALPNEPEAQGAGTYPTATGVVTREPGKTVHKMR